MVVKPSFLARRRLKMADKEFIVELYGGSQFLAPWSGDPGRTCVRESAKRYKSERAARCALTYARLRYPSRDYSEARVASA
jgi:hypothetical protein